MRQCDWRAFCALIKASDEALSAKPRNETALAMMFSVLADYAIDDVRRAVEHHMRSSPYPVKPADVSSFLDGSPDERSAVAWETMLRAVERFGYYDSVRFPEPAYHFVIEQMGGWLRLCEEWNMLTDREIRFRRTEFCRLYELGLRKSSWVNEPGKVQVRGYLLGFHDVHNAANGYALESPVFEVSTGKELSRQALESPAQDNITALPTLEKETRTP